MSEPYDDYCLELSAAYAGKFAHLPDDRMNYAYQLEFDRSTRSSCGRWPKRDGATRVEGKIAEVELDGESGDDRRAEARIRPAHRGRPVHRLHRVPGAADRRGARLGVRGLDALAAQRQRDRDPDALGRARRFRTRWRSRMIPAGSGAFRCSIAPATASSFAAAISTRTQRSNGCSATSRATR